MKLADFGVASTSASAANDGAVVGSPYWSEHGYTITAAVD